MIRFNVQTKNYLRRRDLFLNFKIYIRRLGLESIFKTVTYGRVI